MSLPALVSFRNSAGSFSDAFAGSLSEGMGISRVFGITGCSGSSGAQLRDLYSHGTEIRGRVFVGDGRAAKPHQEREARGDGHNEERDEERPRDAKSRAGLRQSAVANLKMIELLGNWWHFGCAVEHLSWLHVGRRDAEVKAKRVLGTGVTGLLGAVVGLFSLGRSRDRDRVLEPCSDPPPVPSSTVEDIHLDEEPK